MLESTVLNMKLAEKQGLTQDEVDGLEHLHKCKDDLFQTAAILRISPEMYSDVNRKGLVLALEQIEFSMQRMWKFEESAACHTWWYELPGCTCPVMDNKSLFGEEERLYNPFCPFHGAGDE